MTRTCILLLGAAGLGLIVPETQDDQPLPLGPRTPVSADSPSPFAPGTIFVVDSFNQLRHFHATAPDNILGTVRIGGLQFGELILGIDFRPATGQLYALGNTNRIYVINAVTGFASPVGAGFSPALNGGDFGFDFDPTVDRIRVVSDAEENVRLDPDTGAATAIDSPINPAGNLVGSAYSNNFAGATTTRLYGIDSSTDQLVLQHPPISGAITPVGPLGVDATGFTGFDIAAGTGVAYAVLTPPAAMPALYTINLVSGAATFVGTIPGGGGGPIRGLAVVTGPETVFAVTTGNNLIRFNSNTPGTIISKVPIRGIGSDTVLAIDFRPASGELYALGSSSRIYRLDLTRGLAVQFSEQLSQLLSGTDFGFDYDPVADRLRVVSDAEQNFRVEPDHPWTVTVDPNLHPAGSVVAAAHSNNFAGATSTALYHIDSGTDLLLLQNPPDSGVLSAVGPLNVDTTGLAGLDIAPSGMAFASLTGPGAPASTFHIVDLATGTATPVGAIGGGEVIRDVAVRVYPEIIYSVTQTSSGTLNLISFNAATPQKTIRTLPISNLQPGETIVGMDFRPANGWLYVIGSTSRVYRVNVPFGTLSLVGGPFTPGLSGSSFGVDFNPRNDRIRIVSDLEQNLEVDPDTAVVTNDYPALNPPGTVVGAAFSNNFAGANGTTLYHVDSSPARLLTQHLPDTGQLQTVGSLNQSLMSSPIGFDIASGSGKAYVSGVLSLIPMTKTLFTVNLVTGAATEVGPFPDNTDTIIDISVALTPAMSGVDSPGSYVPSTAEWWLRNTNSAGLANLLFKYGAGGPNLIPIKGDWDGDGDDTPGLYDRTTGRFHLRNSSSAGPAEVPTFPFGPGGPDFLPIAGDWDGDGVDTVGIRNSATGQVYLKNTNRAGAADLAFVYGGSGGIPIAGDWNNDNVDTIGLYDPTTATFFLRNSNTNGPADIPPFTFGAPGRTPLAGDWDGDGTDTVGVFDSATAGWFLKNGFTGGPADLAFVYGAPGALGLVGDWDRQ